MKLAERLELGPGYVRAAFEPSTFDAESRTVELCWTTGAEVERFDWDRGRYIESLSLDKKHVRLDRLNSGASLLDNHNAYGGVRSVLGVVEKAWIDGDEGRALVRFSARAEDVMEDVRAGIIRNVSVGYRVHAFRDDTEEADRELRQKRLTAVDWEPFELSLVTIPADAQAGVRSAQWDKTPCEVLSKEPTMTKQFGAGLEDGAQTRAQGGENVVPLGQDTTTANFRGVGTPGFQGAQHDVDLDAERKAAAQSAADAEFARQAEIREHCRTLGLGDDVTERFIASRKSVGQLTKEIQEAYTASQDTGSEIRTAGTTVGEEDIAKRREVAIEAMMQRISPRHKPTQSLGDFAGRSLVDVVRLFETARGRDGLGLTRDGLFRAAFHTTGDLPYLLTEVGNRTLRAEYELMDSTWEPFVTEGTLPDYRPMSRLSLGDAPDIEELPESGDIKYGSTIEAKETVQLAQYGRGMMFGRTALINDDLNALARVVSMQGRRVASLVADLVYEQLLAGTLSDGSIYKTSSPNRKNTITGGTSALTADAAGIAALSALEAKMLVQKSMGNGKDAGMHLNLRPENLIVPVALKAIAEKIVADITPTDVGAVVPGSIKRLNLIVDPRLDDGIARKSIAGDANAWYLTASKAAIDLVQLDWLQGAVGPQFDMDECFENRGIKYGVWADVGASVIEYRGFAKSAGA